MLVGGLLSYLFDWGTRQERLTRFHNVCIVERMPGRLRGRITRTRLLVSHVVTHECFGYTELHIRIDMRVSGIVNLRDQRLEAGLEDQRVQMSGSIGMPLLRFQKSTDDAVARDRVA